jgi:hypothetical protein
VTAMARLTREADGAQWVTSAAPDLHKPPRRDHLERQRSLHRAPEPGYRQLCRDHALAATAVRRSRSAASGFVCEVGLHLSVSSDSTCDRESRVM